jgi:thioredoxin reductase (NADPH)
VLFGAEFVFVQEAVRLGRRGEDCLLGLGDGSQAAARAVIVAAGAAYRRLGIAALDRLIGAGVFYGAARVEAPALAGEHVCVVGGANSAGQAAVFLSRQAKSVTILCRGAALERSMSYYLIQQIREIGNIAVRTCTEVIAAEGSDHLERLTLRDTSTGAAETASAQWLFLFIGAAPLTDWLDGVVDRDDRGFVIAGPDLSIDGDRPRGWELDRAPYHLETSVPGVFVAGDARAESAKRVASAVGEGAMAVMLVHRYLEKL